MQTQRKYLTIAFVIVVLVIASSLTWYMWLRPESETEQTLIVAVTTDIDSLDPFLTQGAYNVPTDLIFEFLSSWKPPGTFELEPGLATSWTVSPDSTVVDYHLREGVKFHDGTTFDATSVKFFIETFKKMEGPLAYMLVDIDEVEIIDTYQIRIHLKHPNVAFPKILSCTSAAMIPSQIAYENAGEEWGKTVLVGTGPFKFVEWIRGESLTLERNEDYWGTKPKLKQIIFQLGMEPSSARMALEAGEVDVLDMMRVSPHDIPPLLENPNIQSQTNLFRTLMLLMNYQFPPLDDVRVRKAIAYAVDVERLRDEAWKGQVEIAYSPIQPWIEPYSLPTFEKYKYDPDMAKDLLKQAGYENGFEIDYIYTLGYSPNVDEHLVLQDCLADVGIKLNMQRVEFAVWSDLRWANELPLTLNGWYPDYPDPENVLSEVISDYGYYSPLCWGEGDPRFNELAIQAKSTADVDQRAEAYHEMQTILADQVPLYPVYTTYRFIFSYKWVKDFVLYPNYSADKITYTNCYITERTTGT